MFDDVHDTAHLFYAPYVRIVTCIALAQVNMQAYIGIYQSQVIILTMFFCLIMGI